MNYRAQCLARGSKCSSVKPGPTPRVGMNASIADLSDPSSEKMRRNAGKWPIAIACPANIVRWSMREQGMHLCIGLEPNEVTYTAVDQGPLYGRRSVALPVLRRNSCLQIKERCGVEVSLSFDPARFKLFALPVDLFTS